MVHGVEKLVLVNEASDDEVYQSKDQNQFRIGEDAVDDTDSENEERLGQVEAVTKNWRLN